MGNGPIIIAGGGIGGLASAVGLSRQGRQVLLLERASAFGEIGAGIQLGPNAFNAFDYLSVGDAARKLAVYIDALRLMDAMTAQEICSIPLGEDFRQRFGNPYAVVHRAELHRVFLDACVASPSVELRTNAEVASFEQDDSGVTVILANGETVRGEALIAADGLWSKIRNQIIGDGPPRVSGHTTYRSVVPIEKMPEDLRWNAATLWAGPKCHIVHYPLSGWKTFNLVVTYHNQAPEPVTGLRVDHDEVRAGFEAIHPKARSIIDIGTDWRKWVLCDRDPAEGWTRGRVTLLGDAAHPMMQYFAQGACIAMEDAVALSHEVAAHGADIEGALQAYYERRKLRTARVQLSSRELGTHVYHPDGAHAQLRNEIMRSKSPSAWFDTLAWLYDGDGLSGVSATRPPIQKESRS